jgi:predicted regulator of Ras-like GTPase activity (Roadblock/LC7/MglB family)
MDAARALADLTEISSQIEAAVVLDQDASLLGSTLTDEARANELAGEVRELLVAAERAAGDKELAQVEVATTEGSVFVVRDGERTIAATTTPEPTVGLVFYDLKSCLRSIAESDEAKPKRRTRKKTEESSAPS